MSVCNRYMSVANSGYILMFLSTALSPCNLRLEGARLVNRLAQPIRQASPCGSTEGECANRARQPHRRPRKFPSHGTVLLRLHLPRDRLELLPELHDLVLQLIHFDDSPEEVFRLLVFFRVVDDWSVGD